MIQTNEGAPVYEHSLDHAVEFFSKANALFVKRESFYGHEEDVLSLFQKTWCVDPIASFKLLLWLRDCRGGAGNRSGARVCYRWLAQNDPRWIEQNIGWLPLVGRWDDLRSLFGTPVANIAIRLWVEAIQKKDVLAAKWADRKDRPLQRKLQINERGLRHLLTDIRKNAIVEYKMCSGNWQEINYEHIPSVAMARYTKAFGRHDEERFMAYKMALKKGDAKVNAKVLFPHDCVRTVLFGDSEIADMQFEALPNYMDTFARVIVIADTSLSMTINVSGLIRPVDISQGMALYCSAKIPENNPFHKKFIAFCSEGEFKSWQGKTFSQAVNDQELFNQAVGDTQIAKALRLILKTALFFNLPDIMMPMILLIVSDMQFHHATNDKDNAEVESCLDEWKSAGYSIPKVIYWNTAGYIGQPATCKHNNVGLVSGFSPAILKSILTGEDFTPRGIMLRAIEKYDIIIP